MEYRKCQNCQSSLLTRKIFSVTTLEGVKIFVNPDMYCGKDCFLSYKVIKNGILNYEFKSSFNDLCNNPFILSSKSGTSQNKESINLLARLLHESME